MDILGIDVGGTTIKGAVVNIKTGELSSPKLQIPTPQSFQPDDILKVISKLVNEFEYRGQIGVGFPAVIVDGKVVTPPTAYAFQGWDKYPIAHSIYKSTNCITTVLNDTDAAGIAEITFGAGKNEMGVVMVITLGTGIGSALFLNGNLVPNMELGHIYLPNSDVVVENQASERIRKLANLSWETWSKRLNDYFKIIERVFSPHLIIVGGEVSNEHAEFMPHIKIIRARMIPATLRNLAGIVGAATAVSHSYSTLTNDAG